VWCGKWLKEEITPIFEKRKARMKKQARPFFNDFRFGKISIDASNDHLHY